MKCLKKILSVLAILLVVSVGIVLPVQADTYVDVTTTGNVQVIINTNGTVHLIYNGVNIQAEINGLKAILASITYQMSQLATKTDMENLNQTVYQLIGELDTILEDLYGKTNFLANVIGLASNSSVVVENLKIGTQTIASYLDSIIATLNNIKKDINTLDNNLSEIYTELQAFENYTEGRFNATYLEIENLGNYTDVQLDNLYNKLHGELQDQKVSTLQLVNSTYIELNELRESLREAVLKDLTTLDSSIQELESSVQDETNRQDFTELEVQDLQQRLYDVENVLGAFVLISIVLAIILVAVGIKRKLRKPQIPETDIVFGDGEQGRRPPKKK